MSRFILPRLAALTAYTPGEQPQDKVYIKLNTNESPYPPSSGVLARIKGEEGEKLNLYPDPQAKLLREKLAERYGLDMENVTVTNGSDEALSFVFMAFCGQGAVFPDITYGFYPVYAGLYGVDYREIPLKEDLSIDYRDYCATGKTVVIANPNAPTGILLPLDEVEEIVKTNPDNLVVLDEAYVDFGGDSAVNLIKKYDNLLVIHTFSKSRSMAGMRIGYALGDGAIISDMEKIRYSVNPYNMDRIALAAGAAALDDREYYDGNCRNIIHTREYTREKMESLGFNLTSSSANFLFAHHPEADGKVLYEELKKRGILVRHFDKPRISRYIRVTVGTRAEMDAFLRAVEDILKP